MHALLEILLFPVIDVVIFGVSYWTGYFFLNGVTFGTLPLAPPLSMGERNRRTAYSKQTRCLWISLPGQGRVLKAEVVCLVGGVVWIALGLGVYWAYR